MQKWEEILDFWFGDLQKIEDRLEELSKFWFDGGERVDQLINERFKNDVILAVDGKYNDWKNEARSCLALIILLDQFSLNIWREQKRAFDQSLIASEIAMEVITKGYDQQVSPIERVFYYLPIEHVEELNMQKKSVELFTQLADDAPNPQKIAFDVYLDYAIKHHDVVEKFGRFPGRNEGLDRSSTPEELAYLEEHGGF